MSCKVTHYHYAHTHTHTHTHTYTHTHTRSHAHSPPHAYSPEPVVLRGEGPHREEGGRPRGWTNDTGQVNEGMKSGRLGVSR